MTSVAKACSIDGCDRKHNARGWCLAHYKRWRKWGDPEANAPRADPVCAVEGCARPRAGRAWCAMHYQRWQRHGDAEAVRVPLACDIEGCNKASTARGWCSRHYTRWLRHGDPLFRIRGEMRDGKRVCPACSLDKPLNEYSDGQAWCKQCFAARKRGNYVPVEMPLALVFCVECGIKFSPSKRTVVCCSERCSWQRKKRFDRQDTLTYRALKANAWIEHVSAEMVYERDAWLCQLCHEPIDPAVRWPDPESASVDHAVPLNRGGEHSYRNTQASHLRCNTSKRDRMN